MTILISEYTAQLKSQIGLPLLLLAGYSLLRYSRPHSRQNPQLRTTDVTSTLLIKDLTNHNKPKALVLFLLSSLTPSPSKSTRRPPSTATASKASLPSSLPRSGSRTPSPFLLFSPRMHENLKRKLTRSLLDLQARREGRSHEPSYRELALRRSIKKNQTRVRSCDLCRIQFSNYCDVLARPSLHSSTSKRPNTAASSTPSSTLGTSRASSAASSASPGRPLASKRAAPPPTLLSPPFPP